jgi:ATP-binding cassette, sub-family E, member 1
MPSLESFVALLEENLRAIIKPQHVDQIPKAIKGKVRTVGALLEAKSEVSSSSYARRDAKRLDGQP